MPAAASHTSLVSTPGTGRPMWPEAVSVPTAKVQVGAASVMPRPVIMRRRSPMAASACRSSSSHTACDNAAPANVMAWQRRNRLSRNTVSVRMAWTIISRPLGTLK